MFILLTVLLIVAIIFEGAMTNLPLVLICLLCLTIVKHDASVFLLAFVAGLFLDAFALRGLGGASIFFLTFVLLIQLYQRKYEINSYQFVLVAAFFGALLYLTIFSYEGVWLLALMSSLLACVLFGIVRLFLITQENNQNKKLHYKA